MHFEGFYKTILDGDQRATELDGVMDGYWDRNSEISYPLQDISQSQKQEIPQEERVVTLYSLQSSEPMEIVVVMPQVVLGTGEETVPPTSALFPGDSQVNPS